MTPFLGGRITVTRGDITTLDVDMIVNAANAALSGGGGVDRAIHRAAGPGLLEECRALGAAKPGDAPVTAGHKLKARFVAHAVGPVWQGGSHDEDATLARCYANALAEAVAHGCSSIAFPSISTGAYKFPLERATRIALTTIADFVKRNERAPKVVLCCFAQDDERTYLKIARALFTTG